MNPRHAIPTVLLAILLVSSGVGFAFAQSEGNLLEDIGIRSLNEDIENSKARLTDLQRRIDTYSQQIKKKETEGKSLKDSLDLLSNRIEKTNLDIEAARVDMDTVNAEIAVLDRQARDAEDRLQKQRELMTSLLQRINSLDNDMNLQVLFGSETFGEIFDRLQSLENLNTDLTEASKKAKLARDQVVATRAAKDGKRRRLEDLDAQLQTVRTRLQTESGAKEGLLAVTKSSESQYRSLLLELKEEQQRTNSEVAKLQRQLESKLDGEGESGPMIWPVDPSYRGISTLFHDPTYPFRHLFEHGGLDVPARQGSNVQAAAPGYVAWVRKGQLYGNYIMIVHADGVATLYAHLSKPLVKPDQFVNRGDIIALSGGLAGSPGAGLSTGPHLHFEVRKEGIPVNPLPYLPNY